MRLCEDLQHNAMRGNFESVQSFCDVVCQMLSLDVMVVDTVVFSIQNGRLRTMLAIDDLSTSKEPLFV